MNDAALRDATQCRERGRLQMSVYDRAIEDDGPRGLRPLSGAVLRRVQEYGGRLLAADEHPRVLKGEWRHDKLVMMSFPDEAAFFAFSNSPDNEEISRDRKAGAEATVLLVKGFAPAG